MKKIVINCNYGCFGLSKEAEAWLRENGYKKTPVEDIARDHYLLIECVETLGVETAAGPLATLKIVEIPDHTEFRIEEYDGDEWVSEPHRTWR